VKSGGTQVLFSAGKRMKIKEQTIEKLEEGAGKRSWRKV